MTRVNSLGVSAQQCLSRVCGVRRAAFRLGNGCLQLAPPNRRKWWVGGA